MKRLILALMLLPAAAFGQQDWSYQSIDATIDDEANVTVTMIVDAASPWANSTCRVVFMPRAGEFLLADEIPYWGGYINDNLDKYGDLVDPTSLDNGDGTRTVTIASQLHPRNITRYIGNNVYVKFYGYFASVKSPQAPVSDAVYLTLDVPVSYSPASGLVINNVCGTPATSIYLESEYPSWVYVKWEWYDDIDAEWKPFISLVNDADNFSLLILTGNDNEALYSIAHNNFSYVGARTDGQSRYKFRDGLDNESDWVTGPNVLSWCGIEPDVTPPTVSAQSGGHSGVIGYFISVTMNEPCVSRFRYRVDAGSWTAWSDWTTTYSTTCTGVYSNKTRNETVDFELEAKDQADLACAANPIQETVLPE